MLGALPDWPYQDYTAQLQPGDQLLLSTDGITEAENAKLEEFGDERLLEAARTGRKRARNSTRYHAAGHGLLRWKFPRRRNLTCSTNLLSGAANPHPDTSGPGA